MPEVSTYRSDWIGPANCVSLFEAEAYGANNG